MRSTLINGGMIATIIGITLFDENLIMKFLFLIGGVVLAVMGLRIRNSERQDDTDD